VRGRVETATAELAHTRARVAALSPAATLERGYAVVQRLDGAVLRRYVEVTVGGEISVRLSAGRLDAVVSGRSPR
jgi:exodeoxyribonuclease VII large subunit